METSLHLSVVDRTGEVRIVNRCIGQYPGRGQGRIGVQTNDTDSGCIGAVVDGPTSKGWVGDERFLIGTIACHRMNLRHTICAALELKMEAELVHKVVVEKIERDHEFIGPQHSRYDLARRVENRPVEVSAIRYIGFDVKRRIGVIGKELC